MSTIITQSGPNPNTQPLERWVWLMPRLRQLVTSERIWEPEDENNPSKKESKKWTKNEELFIFLFFWWSYPRELQQLSSCWKRETWLLDVRSCPIFARKNWLSTKERSSKEMIVIIFHLKWGYAVTELRASKTSDRNDGGGQRIQYKTDQVYYITEQPQYSFIIGNNICPIQSDKRRNPRLPQ